MKLTPASIKNLLHLKCSAEDLDKLLSSMLTRKEFADKYRLTRQMVDLRFRQNELKFIQFGNSRENVYIIDCEENRNVFTSLR
jgi:hypothetical protein